MFRKLTALVLSLPVLAYGLPSRRATCAGGQTVSNAACCALFPVVQDVIENAFDGECGDGAHGALRLLFHDAIGISPTAGGGGADGSIVTFNATELTFHANIGIDDVLDNLGPFIQSHSNVLSPGDMIQLMGVLSLVQCPGAPRLPFLMGRPQPIAASPPNLVPEPFDSVADILARFEPLGFTVAEVVAIVGGSHSIAGADNIVPGFEGVPFDQTPSVFDTQIFVDVQLRGTLFSDGQTSATTEGEVMTAVDGTVRLQSDHLLARDSSTNCLWQSFVNDLPTLSSTFASGVNKLSLLGQNAANLIDCSDVIPAAIPGNGAPATLPPGQTMDDIEQSCATAAFPSLATQPGAPTTVPSIPQAD